MSTTRRAFAACSERSLAPLSAPTSIIVAGVAARPAAFARRARAAAIAASAGIVAFSAAGTARAQGNYRLAPVGGRTTLVGGTGLAYGHDGASAFLNPATAVRIDDARLSFSVNFYTMTFMFAPAWYRAGGVDPARFGQLDVGSASTSDFEFNVLPSSLCFFFRIGDVPWLAGRASEETRLRAARLGLCFASVQSHTFNFAADQYSHASAAGVTRQAQSVTQSFTRFAAGPTYAMNITDELAFGASLHGSIASHRSLFSAAATSYGSTPEAVQSTFYNGARGDSVQLTATAGMTLRLGRTTIAAALESPSVHVYGVGAVNRATHFEGSGQGTSTTAATGSFISRTPLRIALGAGIERQWGSVEVNASYHAPLGTAYSAELEGRQIDRTGAAVTDLPAKLTLAQRARGVFNVGIGGEVFVLPKVSLLGGASTDISAVSDGSFRGTLMNYYASRTHRVAGSFGIGSHGDGGDLLFGGEASFGWGERLAVSSYQLPPDIATTTHGTWQILFVIAGSTSLKSITRAVRDVKELTEDTTKSK